MHIHTIQSGGRKRFIDLHKVIAVATVVLLSACGSSSNIDASARTQSALVQPSSDTVSPPSVSPVAMGDERDCLWSTPVNTGVNTLFPDVQATYWVAALIIPQGGAIRFEGSYPHSRYFSFNIYNELLQPLDGANDTEIRPENGSTNPFDTDANRMVPNRTYTERLIAAVAPQDSTKRLPNTLYSSQAIGPMPVASNLAVVIFRNYVTDRGHPTNESLPRIVFELPNGTTVSGVQACGAIDTLTFAIPNALGLLPDIPVNSVVNTQTFRYPLWLKFFDLQSAEASRLYNTPLGPVVYEQIGSPTAGGGGFASNRDNRYISAAISQNLGSLVVLHPKMPRTPKTVNGNPIMQSGDMRYWSLCSNNGDTLAVIDCLFDEQVTRDSEDRAVIVVSRKADKPSNAIPSCGVTWLNWGTPNTVLLIMRNQLVQPQSQFPNAIQYVPGPPGAHEAEVMKDYYPYGEHMTKANFEALGCPVSPTALASIVTPPP